MTEDAVVDMFANMYPVMTYFYEEYAENVNEAIKKRNQEMHSA